MWPHAQAYLVCSHILTIQRDADGGNAARLKIVYSCRWKSRRGERFFALCLYRHFCICSRGARPRVCLIFRICAFGEALVKSTVHLWVPPMTLARRRCTPYFVTLERYTRRFERGIWAPGHNPSSRLIFIPLLSPSACPSSVASSSRLRSTNNVTFHPNGLRLC
jgi:hypothetical protein